MLTKRRSFYLLLTALAAGCSEAKPRATATSLDDEHEISDEDRAQPIELAQETRADAAQVFDGGSDAGTWSVEHGDSGDALADDGGLVDASESSPEAICGNGVVELGEQCDGEVGGLASCASLGFELGPLECTEQCTFDVSQCEGDERCFDGVDNDGDNFVDCADPRCEAACQDPCTFALNLRELWITDFDGVGTVSSDSRGHGGRLMSACTADADGGEIVYRLVTEQTGVLSARVEADSLMSVSVVTECVWPGSKQQEAPATELACAGVGEELSVEIEEGQELFLVVDGRDGTHDGAFTLVVHERTVECGDGQLDPGEECDDGNSAGLDGCSVECRVETSEIEPNDTPAEASDFSVPLYAQLSPVGDVDYYELTLSEETDALILRTLALGEQRCSIQMMDPVLRMFDEAGDLMGQNDDGGEGYCATLRMLGLAPGTYLIEVTAAEGTPFNEFPYRLELARSTCGDGVLGIEEECDDGNQDAGDTCSPDCRLP